MKLTRQQIFDAVDGHGWRFILGTLQTQVSTGSLAAGGGFAAQVAALPLVAVGEVAARLIQVTVGLQEHDVVPGGGQAVDEGGAVAAAPVGGVGDPGAEESPEAVADPHLLTHHPPSSISPSRPLEARQSRAIGGVPLIGLPLTLREVLIKTGTSLSRRLRWRPLFLARRR